jgi:probable O-glycosylation ligase (exosortase A-associated)
MTRNWRLHHAPAAEWWRPEPAIEVEGRPALAATAAPVSAVTFWALMSFSFVALIAPQELFPVLAPLRIALLTAAAAIVTYLWDRLVHRQPVTVLTREIWITAGLVGWAIVTVPLSYWPGGSVAFLVNFYFKSLAIFWLLANTITTLTRLRQVAWGLSLMTAPLAATAVGHFLSDDFLPTAPQQAVKRIVGYDAPLTGNPNDLALTLNLILPLSVALVLATRRRGLRAVLLVLIGLDIVAVILTFSRGGFLTLATILLTYLWKIRRRPERRWAWAALLVVLAGAPLLPSRYIDRLSTITNLESDTTGSAQLRRDDTVSAVRFVLANPIVGAGVGMNVLALVKERGDNRWTAVHNVYLEYAMELGLPGLALFLLLLAGSFRSVQFVRRRSMEVPALRRLFHLAEGIQVSLVAFTVAALFHPVAYHLYFYYFAALALAVRAVYAVETRQAPNLPLSHHPQWPSPFNAI